MQQESRPLNNHTTTGLDHKFIESDSTAVLCTGSERGRNWINRLPWAGGLG